MWSAAEPCRTRTLSLEMQEPPSERDVTGCCGGGAPVSAQPATHGMAQKVPLGVWQKILGQRQQSRGRDGQDGGGEPAAGCLPLRRRPLHSPEAAAAPLAVLVLGPARPGAAHRGDGGGAKGDADEAALLEEGRVVVGAGPLGR